MIAFTAIQAQVYDAAINVARQAMEQGAGLADVAVAFDVASDGIKADILRGLREAAEKRIVAAPPGLDVSKLGKNGR